MKQYVLDLKMQKKKKEKREKKQKKQIEQSNYNQSLLLFSRAL